LALEGLKNEVGYSSLIVILASSMAMVVVILFGMILASITVIRIEMATLMMMTTRK
jgi:hypothetical protein